MAIVGRASELDLLAREIALATELSSGRALFIEGPAGTGKTALVEEFLEQIVRTRPDLIVARGRCLQTFGSADPYVPFVDALRDLSDESTAGFVRKDSLSDLVRELAPYWLSVVPMVGSLLSAGLSTAMRLRGQPASGVPPSREALFVQYLEVIRRIAEQSPLLLFLDDLHWADQASAALLAHVGRGITKHPVVVLGTLRRTDAELEKHPILEVIRELEREDLALRVPLEDLAGDSLAGLLAAEFGGDVSAPLQRWVVETAGGNPLFVTELSRLLRESGAAIEERGEWLLTDAVADMEVPRSAEAAIETRIDKLAPEEVRLLQYASVEGNEFTSTLVSRLLGEDELEVLDALDRIERHYRLLSTTGEVELPDGDVATRYAFRHALVQTVLYRQVLGKRRILLHRKAGEILESIHGDSIEAVAGQLARHFHEGRQREPAHRYACAAADAARLLYAHWEAEELYRIALHNAPGPEEEAAIEERLGDIYDTVGYYPQGISSYERSLGSSESGSPNSLRLRRKILVLERKSGITPSPVLLHRVRALLAEAEETPLDRLHLLLELVRFPDAQGVREALEEAVTIATMLDDPSLVGYAEEQLALRLILSGEPEEALEHLRRAAETVQGASDPLRTARYANFAGIAHAKLGRYTESLREFEEMRAMYERVGDPNGIGCACTNIGHMLLRIGRLEEAEEVLQRARVIHERRDRATLVQSLFNLAERARRAGETQLARERYEALLACARELDLSTYEAVAKAGIGLCFLEENRLEEAREAALGAVSALADRDGWFEDREYVEILLARLEASEGRVKAAAARLAGAAKALASSDIYAWARVELERARLLLHVDPEATRDALAGLRRAGEAVGGPLTEEILRLRNALSQERATEGAV